MRLRQSDNGTRALKARASHVLGQAQRQIADLEDEAVVKLRKAGRHGRAYARENPWLVFGAAAVVAGVVAGWLLRRRARDAD